MITLSEKETDIQVNGRQNAIRHISGKQIIQGMFGVCRSFVLKENFKNKTKNTWRMCTQGTSSKKILFSNTFSELHVEHE